MNASRAYLPQWKRVTSEPEKHQGAEASGQRPPPVAEEVGEAQQHPGRQRQLGVEVLEEDLELRQHVDREHHHGEHRHDRDGTRVDQRGLDLAPRLEVALDVDREPGQHRVQLAGELGGADHAAVEAGEHLGVALEAVGEPLSGAQSVLDVVHHPAHRGALALGADRVHRLEDRQTGPEERRDLARQVHHVGLLDPRPADLVLEDARLLLDPQVTELLAVERDLGVAAAGGPGLALDLLAVRRHRDVGELRHLRLLPRRWSA